VGLCPGVWEVLRSDDYSAWVGPIPNYPTLEQQAAMENDEPEDMVDDGVDLRALIDFAIDNGFFDRPHLTVVPKTEETV
jgi:hypothetical protein